MLKTWSFIRFLVFVLVLSIFTLVFTEGLDDFFAGPEDFYAEKDGRYYMAQEVSNYAGLYLNEEGVLTLILVPKEDTDSQLQSLSLEENSSFLSAQTLQTDNLDTSYLKTLIKEHFGEDSLRSGLSSHLKTQADPEPIQVVFAKYTYVQLLKWQDQVRLGVLENNAEASVNIDEQNNRIWIFLSDGNDTKVNKDLIQKIIDKAQLPEDAYLIEYIGEFSPAGKPKPPKPKPEPEKSLRNYIRPLQAGTQILVFDTGELCSIGFLGASTSGFNRHGFVTAGHCFFLNSKSNSSVYQPTDDLVGGFVTASVDERISARTGVCSRYRTWCVGSDAAFIKLNSSVDYKFGAMANVPFNAIRPVQEKNPATHSVQIKASVFKGEKLTYIGRTNGRRSLKVAFPSAVLNNTANTWRARSGQNVNFVIPSVILAEFNTSGNPPKRTGGDSGGIVVSGNQIVGIFQGQFYYRNPNGSYTLYLTISKIKNILSDVDVSVQ